MSRAVSDDRPPTRPKAGAQAVAAAADRRPSPPSKPAKSANPQQSFDDVVCDWDDTVYDDLDKAASDRARRLLARSGSPLDRFRFSRRRFAAFRHSFSGRWPRRVGLAFLVLLLVGGTGFGLLWWRLGAGPINLDIATPWLAAAMEDNFGSDYNVEVGGTQIERAGRVRIAVRIRDIVVRDRDQTIVASAPKAEVRVSGTSLMMGKLRAESLNLVGAELSVRIAPDGQVTVSTSSARAPEPTAKPIELPRATSARFSSTSAAPAVPQPSTPAVTGTTPPAAARGNGLAAALDWIDRLSASGLDGHDLTELGLKNGNLIVDDQQSGKRWNFQNISLSVRRPRGGGVAFSVGEEGQQRPWDLRAEIGPPVDGVRSFDLRADKVSTQDILLALRMNDMSFSVDIPFSGRLRGEIARDGLPTFLTGKIVAGAGLIVDRKTPDFPMTIDRAEFNVEWDSTRRALIAPFQVVSGANRFTLFAHIEPPGDVVPNWQFGLSGSTILLAGEKGEEPVAFNNISVAIRFDTANKKILLTQGNIGNGQVGIAGTGSVDYSGAEPRLTAGLAGTPMSASVLKRIWPVVITPELRAWVIQRVERGQVQRMDIAVNAPMNTLARDGPPIPDDGLAINITASNVTVRPVDEMPAVRDADFRARITGRTATVNIAQGTVDTPGGRKLTIGEYEFKIADMAPKPMQSVARFRIDGPVPAAAEILSSDRLNEFSALPIDPATSKGTVSAVMTLGLPIKDALSKSDTTYTLAADLKDLSAERVAMGQKLEASLLKVQASNQGFQIRGDVKIGGMPANIDYRKASTDTEAEIRIQATLDDASRARLGMDLGSAFAGAVPLKVTGRLGTGDRDSRFNVDADLTGSRIENVLPGWSKPSGKAARAQFSVAQKPQSTRFDDIVIDGGGMLIRGSLELDQNNDLMTAVFPAYQPSEGDRASLKAERAGDGTLKVIMRGDVFDGRGYIKSAVAGSKPDGKGSQKSPDIDIDVKLGVVMGANTETARNVDVKLVRRGGIIRSFGLSGKLGRDANLNGDLRARSGGRDVLYVESSDAGAFFRFADSYSKIIGGQMWMAMDPPTTDQAPQEGLINVRDFSVRGESALDRAANGNNTNGVAFTQARAEFTRQAGQLSVREGVVRGPLVGATIAGNISYASNQVSMRGTFIPAYGLNNMFGQIPIVGLFLGGGSDEGLVGITYEVVGSPSSPTLRVNPISAITPGVFRKIFEFQPPPQPGAARAN